MAGSYVPSTKVGAAGLGGAVATIFWLVASLTFWEGVFPDAALTSLTGSSATVLAFLFGYFTPAHDG